VDKTLIHIGYPKTGTTWFQNSFFNKIQNFSFIDRREVKEDFILPNSLDFNADKIREKYKGISKPLILSHELLVGGMIHMGGINGILTQEFAKRLNAVFPNAHIIIFIRNQIDHIASAYNQYIRGGGNLNINKYLYQDSFDALNKFFFFSFAFLEFDKIISFYKTRFGENNIHVFMYEKFKDNPEQFIKEFCSQFDIKANLSDINYEPTNISFRKYIKPIFKSANLLYRRAVIHKINFFKLDKFHETVKYRLNLWNKHKIFGQFEDSKQILGKKNYDFIKNYYKEPNKKLIDQHGLVDIKKYNYPL